MDAGDLMENFFVWAVVSVIGIRVFLSLTGYPQILPAEDIHIAHTLFGGFLMLFALSISFVFLNREAKQIASIIGGIGFGTFIDELGKFITKNNDYHYEPAIALIYIILATIFLISRVIEKYFTFSPEEYAVNAVEMVKQALVHDLEKNERSLSLKYLKKANQDNPLVATLKMVLQKIQPIPNKNATPFHRFRNFLKSLYFRLIKNPNFNSLLIIFFVSYSTVNFFQALLNFKNVDSFFEWGHIASTLVSGLFVLAGVSSIIRKSRKKAYTSFRFAVLVHIFLTQFFLFVENQFAAVLTLAASIVIWNTLQYLISEEKLLGKKEKLILQVKSE
jgi:hypothetical protein